MNYLVTGGTGFIGRFLIARLLQREGAQVHALVREGSTAKFDGLVERFPEQAKQLHAVHGDVTQDGLMSAAARRKLVGKIDHVFHLAAVYDMNMDDATADRVNNEGTRNLVNFVNGLGGNVRLHHVSSIAVAGGGYVGRFSETMFDEGQDLDHPYFRTKFQSEKIVREESSVPFRVYRPGTVVGSSETGEMDKVDGPYYFFKTIQRIRDAVPKWLPLMGVEGGHVPVVPVDYVAAAMDELAHRDGLDGQSFHLVQRNAPTVGDLIQLLLEAAHGPEITRNVDLPPLSLPRSVRRVSRSVTSRLPIDIERTVSRTIGIPVSVLGYINNRAIFDDRKTRAALKDSGIKCPEFHDYVERLWHYWEAHLDTHVRLPPELPRKVAGKVVLITGASSGIGFTTAKKLAAAGARVIMVARKPTKLEEARQTLLNFGSEVYAYACDLADMDAVDRLGQQVLKDFGHVDILINNAGRSIRRAVAESYGRFHDFERTMELNYYGAVRMIMALLPTMSKRRQGHIINISSIGVLANAARFSAYVASKAALDAFTRCLSAEIRGRNIHTTAIYMPLVRTPMIAPTKIYDYVPTWSPDDAADTVMRAIIKRPKSIATPLGTAAALSYAMWPKVNDYVLSKGFQLFPSSSAAKGGRKGGEKPTLEQVVFANLFKGEHW